MTHQSSEERRQVVGYADDRRARAVSPPSFSEGNHP